MCACCYIAYLSLLYECACGVLCVCACVRFHHCTSLLTGCMSDDMNTNIHLQYQAKKHLSSYAKHLISKFLFACQCTVSAKASGMSHLGSVCLGVHACVRTM